MFNGLLFPVTNLTLVIAYRQSELQHTSEGQQQRFLIASLSSFAHY